MLRFAAFDRHLQPPRSAGEEPVEPGEIGDVVANALLTDDLAGCADQAHLVKRATPVEPVADLDHDRVDEDRRVSAGPAPATSGT
jgi:hypothetical protein